MNHKRTKKLLDIALKEAEQEVIEAGEDTTSPEFKNVLYQLKIKILNQLGVNVLEFEEHERGEEVKQTEQEREEFDKKFDLLDKKIDELSKREINWEGIKNKPEIPTEEDFEKLIPKQKDWFLEIKGLQKKFDSIKIPEQIDNTEQIENLGWQMKQDFNKKDKETIKKFKKQEAVLKEYKELNEKETKKIVEEEFKSQIGAPLFEKRILKMTIKQQERIIEPVRRGLMGARGEIDDLRSLISKENLWNRSNSTLTPNTANDSIDLGSGNFTTTGEGTFDDITVDTYVKSTLKPVSDNAFDLGASNTFWRNLYIGTQVIAETGRATSPPYSFKAQQTTGMYSEGGSILAFTTAGTKRLSISSDGNFDFQAGNLTTTGAILGGGAGHDQFSDFVGNEHIDHSGVSVTAGSGLSGGGDITTTRTIDLDINSLSVATIASGDFVPFWDITATATNKKITFANFEGTLSHDSLSGVTANEHINWTNTNENLLTTGTARLGATTITSVFGPQLTLDSEGDTATFLITAGGDLEIDVTSGIVRFLDDVIISGDLTGAGEINRSGGFNFITIPNERNMEFDGHTLIIGDAGESSAIFQAFTTSGTFSNPGFVGDNKNLWRAFATVHKGVGQAGAAGIIRCVSVGAHSSSNLGCKWIFKSTKQGETAGTDALTIDGNQDIIIPAGVRIGSSVSPTVALDVTGEAIVNDKIKMTSIGGFAVKLTNKTGSNTIKGQLVQTNTALDDSFVLAAVDEKENIGIVLDAGVSDGSEAWIVTSGIADIAMKDNTAATRGNWVKSSDEAGYSDATNASPPGGGIPELDEHMQEIGNCIESVSAGGGGTHILARCVLHFN